MDSESLVLPILPSKEPHSLEDAARLALGECRLTCPDVGNVTAWSLAGKQASVGVLHADSLLVDKGLNH